MDSKFVKGLIAAIIGALAAIYGTEHASFAFYAISVFAAVVVYFVQHAFIKPVTVFGSIDLTDILKGALMAIGTAASAYGASLLVPDVQFALPEFLNTLWAALVLYLSKNLFTNSKNAIGPEPK